MAFVTNDVQQLSFNDPMFQLSERERKYLEKSWAKFFADRIFPAIKEDEFSVLYSKKASRPNTPVNIIIGALILKEVFSLTDEEIVQSLIFDLRFQYALHTTSYREQPLSERSLSRFRARNLAYESRTGQDLLHNCIVSLSKEIGEFLSITSNMEKMDSEMVAANIHVLSMLELLYTSVVNLVKVMNKNGEELPEKQKHYAQREDYNRFIYREHNLNAEERLQMVIDDAHILMEVCGGSYDDTSEYQLLLQLLKEQSKRK